jgi:hypothetical protein
MTIKRHRLALGCASALALLTLARISSTLGQSGPALTISLTGSNSAVLTITNGTSNGFYQFYYTEYLGTNAEWVLLNTNTTRGVTSIVANLNDTVQGFFRAANNTNFVEPTLTIIIQSPTNGALIY